MQIKLIIVVENLLKIQLQHLYFQKLNQILKNKKISL
jgi:hypothetical protein